VVKLADVRAALSDDEPVVAVEQRRARDQGPAATTSPGASHLTLCSAP